MIGRALNIAISVVLAFGLAGGEYSTPGAGDEYPIRRTVRYRLTVRNTSGESLREAEFRVYAPVRRTASQLTMAVKASHPFEVRSDELGNQLLCFRVDLAPYAVKVVSVEATVAFATIPNPDRLANANEFTRPDPLTEVEDPRIQQTALNLGGSSPDDVAQRAYEWVTNHVVHTGYVAEDRGALSALMTGKGDCTESMYLFTALARARGIPARGMGGFIVREGGVFRAADYHNWAEFYAEGHWQLADPKKRAFRKSNVHYVATRILGDDGVNGVDPEHRLNVSDARVEVGMD